MATKYWAAPDVRDIACEIIADHHQHLHEYGIHVEYIFRNDVPSKNGHEVWGTARKMSGLAAFLRNDIDRSCPEEKKNWGFFVITISFPIWEKMNDSQKRALVDHELMHCGAYMDDNGPVMYLKGHDFEGFNAEIVRHGLWRDNAKTLARAIEIHRQGKLFEVPPRTDGARERLEPDTYHRGDAEMIAAQP